MKKFRARRKLLSFIIFFLLTIFPKEKIEHFGGEKEEKSFYWISNVLFFLIKYYFFFRDSDPHWKMVQSRPTRSLILNWDFTHRSAFIFHILIRMQLFLVLCGWEKIGKFSPHSCCFPFLSHRLILRDIHVVLENLRELFKALSRSILRKTFLSLSFSPLIMSFSQCILDVKKWMNFRLFLAHNEKKKKICWENFSSCSWLRKIYFECYWRVLRLSKVYCKLIFFK